jgi:uncharacterized membrane protein YkoI
MQLSLSKQWLLALGLCACVFLACDTGSDSSSPEDSLRSAAIGMSEAIAAAEAEVANGVTIEAEFEVGKDGAVFEVAILVDGEVREALVDPSDGRILSVTSDPEDLEQARATAERLATARLSLADAIAVAERATGGTVFEIEVDGQGFELAVLTDDGPLAVVVSASDGSILATERAEHGPELDENEEDEADEPSERDDD